MNSTQPDYWEQRYRAGRTPWDFHGVPPALDDFLQRHHAGGSVLIPGCGSAYEVRAFCDAGWRVVAIDFSPTAVARAKELLGPLGAAVQLADFFRDDFGCNFELIYERTFLCSLPPDRWHAYARRVARLLKPGGALVGIFAFGNEPEPPPFPMVDDAVASALFDRWFERAVDREIAAGQSLPLFAGMEHWQEWRRRSATGQTADR